MLYTLGCVYGSGIDYSVKTPLFGDTGFGQIFLICINQLLCKIDYVFPFILVIFQIIDEMLYKQTNCIFLKKQKQINLMCLKIKTLSTLEEGRQLYGPTPQQRRKIENRKH